MSRAGRHRAGPGGQECHNVVSNERGDNTGTNSAHYQTTNTGVIADWSIKAENTNGTDGTISFVKEKIFDIHGYVLLMSL